MAKSIAGFPYYEAKSLEDLLPQGEVMSPEDWARRYEGAKSELVNFVRCRDPYLLLAKTAFRHIVDSHQDVDSEFPKIELHELEILQAIVLAVGVSSRGTPASPRACQRLWRNMAELPKASLGRLDFAGEAPEQGYFRKRIQAQTAYYRFLFDAEECVLVMDELLSRFDAAINGSLELAKNYKALLHVTSLVSNNIEVFRNHIRELMSASNKAEIIAKADVFCSLYPSARKAWRYCEIKELDLQNSKWAVFQIAELSYPWIFTVAKEKLEEDLGDSAVKVIERLSLKPGDLDESSIDKAALNNPVWKKPYLLMPNGDIFCALPQSPFSFPFQIIESMISKDEKLLNSFSEVKAAYLEDKVAEVLAKSAPSARIFRSVVWDDPATGVRYENDVLAIVGNFIFMFEAKSGKINSGARRGAERSLKNDLKALFVEPAIQAQRLQSYLNVNHATANLREKGTGRLIDLDLTRPKIVHRFSVCFEHFARLTSTRHNFEELGFIDAETPWAPVFSLGELLMISKHLDSEISFIHYLTRRFTIEKQIDFEGDEQDLLSLFLANGFCVSKEGFPGSTVNRVSD